MDAASVIEEIDRILARLRDADWKGREAIKAELMETAKKSPSRLSIVAHLEGVTKGLPLEARWDVEEVVEALRPPPPPPKPAEPKPADAKEAPPPEKAKGLSAADLQMVYDDPRGLVLYKTKVGDRWFATQVDPRSGQPQTFELHGHEVTQLKTQLAGSPYWVIGSGEGPSR